MVFIFILIPFLVLIYFFLHQPSFGKAPSGKDLAAIQPSPNFKNGKFQNLTETKMSPPGVSFFTILKEFLKDHPDTEPTQPIPVIKRNLKAETGSDPVITWFGHSSYLLQIAGKNILVDPVFCERTSPVQFAGSKAFMGTQVFSINDLPQIDYMMLTHDHYDHLDYAFIKAIGNKPAAYITSLGVGSHLRRWGIQAAKITTLDWWQSIKLDETIELHAAPARHFSGRSFSRANTLWSSFVLMAAGYKIYIGGDSGYEAHFKMIGERFGPFDLTILECGQYNAYWPYIHMMPEETVQAAIDLKAKCLLPVHWGKFKLSMHPWYEPIERVTAAARLKNMSIATPMIGEAFEFSKDYPSHQWWKEVFK